MNQDHGMEPIRSQEIISSGNVVFALPIKEDSIATVLELGEAVRKVTNTTFSRSNDPRDSHYPRVTLLALSDLKPISGGELSYFTSKFNTEIGEPTLQCSGLRRTESGIVLLDFNNAGHLIELRLRLAEAMIRLRSLKSPSLGYKYIDQPLHLTVATDVKARDMEKLKDIEASLKGKPINLGSLQIFEPGDWNKNRTLKFLKS